MDEPSYLEYIYDDDLSTMSIGSQLTTTITHYGAVSTPYNDMKVSAVDEDLIQGLQKEVKSLKEEMSKLKQILIDANLIPDEVKDNLKEIGKFYEQD